MWSSVATRRGEDSIDGVSGRVEPVLNEVVVLTSQGGMLDIEPGSGRLVQSPCNFSSDRPCVHTLDGQQLALTAAPSERVKLSCRVKEVGAGLVALEINAGTFLRASPGLGPVSMDAPEAAGWEQFRLLSVAEFRLLSRLAAARWLVGTDDRPTVGPSLRFTDGFRINFAGRSVALDDLLGVVRDNAGARTPHGLPMSFSFFHGTCSISKALLYNPLVYGTIGGGEQFFEQIAICFASLERFGLYDGSYRLVCDRERKDAADCFRGIDAARWDTIPWNTAELDALVSARMEILTCPDFDGFQPILYLDSDVVCDGPIEKMLVAAARSERILIASEFGDRTVQQVGLPHGNWFGLFLQEADSRIGKQYCINNGIFAVKNRQSPLESLAAVAESWARFKAAFGDAHHSAYDQPFYSSVLQSLDMADMAAMNRWVCILQGLEPTGMDEPVGLTHFNIGVGMNKTQAMLRYVAMLEERQLSRLATS